MRSTNRKATGTRRTAAPDELPDPQRAAVNAKLREMGYEFDDHWARNEEQQCMCFFQAKGSIRPRWDLTYKKWLLKALGWGQERRPMREAQTADSFGAAFDALERRSGGADEGQLPLLEGE